MVGPISTEERTSAAMKLKLGLTAVIAASGGLIAVQGDASLPIVLAAVVVGAIVGAALIWFVFPGTGETRSDRDRRFERR